MCPRCHTGISDEDALRQLNDIFANPQFDKWNETSLSHLAICLSGYNGDMVSKLANQLFDNYIEWKKNSVNETDGSFFGNPTVIKANFYKSVGKEVKENSVGLSKDEMMKLYHEVYEDHLNDANRCIIS